MIFQRILLMNYGMVIASLDQTSILHILGSSLLQILLLKYGIKYLKKLKKQALLQFLKVKFKKVGSTASPLETLQNIYGKTEFYIINLLIFDGNPSVTFF